MVYQVYIYAGVCTITIIVSTVTWKELRMIHILFLKWYN